MLHLVILCYIIMAKETGTALSELCQKPEFAPGVGIPPCPYIPMFVLAPQWEEILYTPFSLFSLYLTYN